jgi:hypothetical protein
MIRSKLPVMSAIGRYLSSAARVSGWPYLETGFRRPRFTLSGFQTLPQAAYPSAAEPFLRLENCRPIHRIDKYRKSIGRVEQCEISIRRGQLWQWR